MPKGLPQSAGIFAVLTGDIIASTELSAAQLEKARALLSECARRIRSRQPGAIYGRSEFFRGDAWQLLLAEPRWALRSALLIRAMFRAELDIDTRVAIGIGGVDTLTKSRVSLSTGEAFTLSGRALDRITGHFQLTGALPDDAGDLAEWFPVVLHLCSGLMRSWTRRQAEIAARALLLRDATHESIAASLTPPVSKQTVTDSLAGANWRTLLEPVRLFEAADWSRLAPSRTSHGTKTGKSGSPASGRSKRLPAGRAGRA
ncbi:MAG: hypothetical protein KGJ78_12825 [Alphaproteobacteria bacterium]|nr:hypothetical protein [Alphaproteobacteria bacterium]